MRMLRKREERRTERQREGRRVKLKAQGPEMLEKRERIAKAFDVVDPRVTARNGIKQWTAGIATLDRMFG